jgi:penicillin-binding protein 1A
MKATDTMSKPSTSSRGETRQADPLQSDEEPVESTRLVRFLKAAVGVSGALFVLFAVAGFYLYHLSTTLPDLDVGSASFTAARTSIVYAADGSVLAEWHGEQDRKLVTFDEIGRPMRDAIVAVEDERFFEHHGVDYEAIARAMSADAASRSYAQGGSTITQQLVKLLFTEGDRTLGRKLREALLAYQLETRTDKKKVLETYLNVVYFGRGSYGVESAARSYFRKSASGLSVAESALLAGVVRSPAKYSPVTNPAAARERRDLVLGKMRQQGYITADQERAAKREPVSIAPARDVPPLAPHFVEYVKADLIGRLGADSVYKGGLRVHTTLDRSSQEHAENVARSTLPDKGDPDVALISLEPKTGRIVAMVGGKDFARDQYNLATQGKRQPGSAFKTFVLVAALEKGISPDQEYDATPYSVAVKDGIWNVQNYENMATSPRVSLRTATNWSVNAVFARLIMSIGPDRVVDTAKRMGIRSQVETNPAIALGGLSRGVSTLEMASAYGTLANGGMHVEPVAIDRVIDDRGRTLYEPKARPRRAVSQRVSEQAAAMLHDVVEQGTGSAARVGVWAAGKTGTTQSYRDAWFVGWSGDLATAVWVGYPKSQVSMTNVHGIRVTGGSYPAVVWGGYMTRVAAKGSVPATSASPPGGLVQARICEDTFLLADKRCPNVIEMYLPAGRVPAAVCGRH